MAIIKKWDHGFKKKKKSVSIVVQWIKNPTERAWVAVEGWVLSLAGAVG